MNPFAEKYKTLSVAQLLKIRGNPQNYQPFAVEAAEAELQGRDLSDTELADAAAELKTEADEAKARAEKREKVSNQLRSQMTAIAGSFHPWQPLSSRNGQLILCVCIVQTVIALKLLWDGVSGVIFAMHVAQSWPMVISVLNLFFGLFAISAIYLFLRGKTIGWILLSAFTVFFNLVSLTSIVFIIIRALRYSFIGGSIWVSSWLIMSEAVLCTFCTWIIYKKWMRDIYKIDRFWQVSTVCIGFLLALAIFMQFGT
jgi:hypothetical protein